MFMIFERIVPFSWLLMFTVPRGKEKSPELEGGSGHPPRGDGGGGGGARAGVVSSFLGLAFLGFLKDQDSKGFLTGRRW